MPVDHAQWLYAIHERLHPVAVGRATQGDKPRISRKHLANPPISATHRGSSPNPVPIEGLAPGPLRGHSRTAVDVGKPAAVAKVRDQRIREVQTFTPFLLIGP